MTLPFHWGGRGGNPRDSIFEIGGVRGLEEAKEGEGRSGRVSEVPFLPLRIVPLSLPSCPESDAREEDPRPFGEWFPEFDLSETKDELVVKAEVPGISPKDINISLVDNTLTIKGEKKQQMAEKNENYHYIGRSYGVFARSISLPREVQADKVTASYKDGILKIVLPKSAESKEKDIQIKIEQ